MSYPQFNPPATPPADRRPSDSASNADLLGAVGLVIVGVLSLIGGLLPWVSVTMTVGGPFSQSIQGPSFLPATSSWRTGIAVALGAFILSCAAAYMFGRRDRRLLSVMTVLSLILLGFGIYNVVDVYRQANDLYGSMSTAFPTVFPTGFPTVFPTGFPTDFPTGFPTVPFGATGGPVFNARDFLHIDPAPGLWMVAVAGLLGTVLSVSVSIYSARVRRAAPAQVQPLAPPPGSGPTQSVPPAEPPVPNS
jgi:hypothetical protein